MRAEQNNINFVYYGTDITYRHTKYIRFNALFFCRIFHTID
ncbi:hypothetical protein B4135_0534 [Caldibacillus debilis]|uniref:Uncharacterized protein n=1 Tax=Caldibacillus debilis TaxID=301148 RepID=A0A150MAG6_9BACI|nr:hypothetical protein B4135_0534 [Caldibacillus debilis]